MTSNIQPQPAVGSCTGEFVTLENTGSAPASPSSGFLSSRGAPVPPAAASRPGVLPKLSIDQDATLWIGDADDPARLRFTAPEAEAIFDFLHATESLWRP